MTKDVTGNCLRQDPKAFLPLQTLHWSTLQDPKFTLPNQNEEITPLNMFPASSPRKPSPLPFSSLESLDKMGTVLTGAGERPASRSWQEHSLSHLLMKISWAPGAPSLCPELGGSHCINSVASEAEVPLRPETDVASWAEWSPWVSWAKHSVHLFHPPLSKDGGGVGGGGGEEQATPYLFRMTDRSLLVNSGRPSFGTHQARELLYQLQKIWVFIFLCLYCKFITN